MKAVYLTCFVLLLTASSCSGQSFSCKNFELPELGKDFIYLNYSNALLRIQSGDEAGTGYLIDSTRGYVITAAHVVEASIKNPAVPISGTNPDVSSKPFRLKHVRNLQSQNIDIALLQLVPSGAMANVEPLDIALRPPRPSRPAYVFGYPEGESSLSQQPADYVKGNENGTMTVKQAAFPGDSGSPLIDETGKVVGTCIERKLTQERHVSNEAIYVPVTAIQEILKKISISVRVRLLDNKIRNRETSRDELSRELLPTAKNMSNVELYSWAWYLKFHPSPRIAATHFPCPFFRALYHRKLDDAVEFLAQTDPATKAAVLIAQGQRLEFFNNLQQASAKYSEAQALVAGLTNDAEAEKLQLTSLEGLARVQSDLGNVDGARSYLSNAVDLSTKMGDRESQSDLLAQLARVDFKRGDPLAIDHLQKAIDIQKKSDKSPIIEATNALVTKSRSEVSAPAASAKGRFWIILAIVLWIAVTGSSSILLHWLRIGRWSSELPSAERAIARSNNAPYTPDDWQLIGDAVVEAWKKTVDVQQQFNDIELRIRNYAITLLVAIVGAAGYAANAKIMVKILGHAVPLGAPLLVAGLVSLAGFYFMDRFWYHRLLQGAVKHGMAIEERCRVVCDAIGLSVSIKKESPIPVRKSKIHSEGKIDIFYGVIALMLILMIVAFGFSTP